MSAIDLPPLEQDCSNCTGDAADEERAVNSNAWAAWRSDEHAAFKAWVAAREARGNVNAWDPDAWQYTDEYRTLTDRQPVEIPAVGCVECDYTGRRLTDAGRQVLEVVRRWAR